MPYILGMFNNFIFLVLKLASIRYFSIIEDIYVKRIKHFFTKCRFSCFDRRIFKTFCLEMVIDFYFIFLLLLLFFTLQYCIGFAIHQHASGEMVWTEPMSTF